MPFIIAALDVPISVHVLRIEKYIDDHKIVTIDRFRSIQPSDAPNLTSRHAPPPRIAPLSK